MSSSVNILFAQLCFDSSCPHITPQISLELGNAKYLDLRLHKDLNPYFILTPVVALIEFHSYSAIAKG